MPVSRFNQSNKRFPRPQDVLVDTFIRIGPILALLSSSVVMLGIYRHWPVAQLASAAFIFGLSIFACAVNRAIRRGALALQEIEQVASATLTNSRNSASPSTATKQLQTGISMLDTLLYGTKRTCRHLLETVAALGTELEDLIERYELLTTNIAAAVVIRNQNGRVIFCSPYTEVLTGYTIDEITSAEGDFFDGIVLEIDRDRYRRAIGISQIGEDIVVRYQIRHQSGIVLWVETHFVPVLDSDSEISSVMGVTIDVTSSVRHQQKIEEQNRDLNDFTYMVSHDLKAPIFTIKGMASLLIEDLDDKLDEDSRESLEHIVEGATRLEKLIKSVIDYSALSTKEIREEEVYLGSVLTQVLQDLSQQIKESEAQIEISPHLPCVLGESVRLYQALSNLIGNAIKYRSPDRAPHILISVREHSPDLVIIDIKDNGLGIPANKLADVFRPYHRVHMSVEGSGIGLASVKKIAEKLGGSVGVTSIEGKGSTFSLALRLPTGDSAQEVVAQ